MSNIKLSEQPRNIERQASCSSQLSIDIRCAICLVVQPNYIKKLPCNHFFCVGCIRGWEEVSGGDGGGGNGGGGGGGGGGNGGGGGGNNHIYHIPCPLCRITFQSVHNWPTVCLLCGDTKCDKSHSGFSHTLQIQWEGYDEVNKVQEINRIQEINETNEINKVQNTDKIIATNCYSNDQQKPSMPHSA